MHKVLYCNGVKFGEDLFYGSFGDFECVIQSQINSLQDSRSSNRIEPNKRNSFYKVEAPF